MLLGKGHVLYTRVDFSAQEIENSNLLAVAVTEEKLAVCKKCGQNGEDLKGTCPRSVYALPAMPAASSPPAA